MNAIAIEIAEANETTEIANVTDSATEIEITTTPIGPTVVPHLIETTDSLPIRTTDAVPLKTSGALSIMIEAAHQIGDETSRTGALLTVLRALNDESRTTPPVNRNRIQASVIALLHVAVNAAVPDTSVQFA